MRLTFAAVATAVALAAFASAEPASDNNKQPQLEKVLNKATGKMVSVDRHSSGNPLGDIDEDVAVNVVASGSSSSSPARSSRRSNKHKHRHSSRGRAIKVDPAHYTSGPQGNAKLISGNVQITWYASQDLKNPQCGDGTWSPNNSDHIGAVMAGWDSGPKCGQFVQVCNPDKDNRCAMVRVVDKCAGCDANAIDLTQSVFRMLAPSGTLDEGRIYNVHMYEAEDPEPWAWNLFGPVNLRSS